MKNVISTKSPSTISSVVIAKNEQDKIRDCLKSVSWTDEILVIDNCSTDKTSDIANKEGARVVFSAAGAYKESREKGMREAKGDWVLYIDADERVTPELKDEITLLTHNPQLITHNFSAYAIPRRNVILGREMKHGGWWPDYVVHFIKKSSFKGWHGDLHEEPVFRGKLGYFNNPLVHLKHDNLTDMVTKTNTWSEVEARLMLSENHPPMNLPRFASAVFREFWLRMFKNRAFLDGSEGIIYAIYQVYSRFITYSKLWEKQIKSK